MAFGGQLASLPIIAVSAYPLRADKNVAFTAGASDFLTKPVRKPVPDEAIRSFAG